MFRLALVIHYERVYKFLQWIIRSQIIVFVSTKPCIIHGILQSPAICCIPVSSLITLKGNCYSTYKANLLGCITSHDVLLCLLYTIKQVNAYNIWTLCVLTSGVLFYRLHSYYVSWSLFSGTFYYPCIFYDNPALLSWWWWGWGDIILLMSLSHNVGGGILDSLCLSVSLSVYGMVSRVQL